MTWLRLDDGFAGDPKICALSDREFRWWLRTLCYCARYRDPALPAARYDEIGVPHETRERFAALGLVDVVPEGHAVHEDDWRVYCPTDWTAVERQRRHRAKRHEPPP